MDTLQNASKTRDYGFDNVKGLLIFLVVLGHALSHFTSSNTPVVKYLYALVYSFHMPAFILISGYFSKLQRGEGQRSDEKLMSSVLLPFLVFHTLMWAITKHSLPLFMTPAWTMWYLLSLFFWKLSVPVLSKLKHIVWVAVVLSLIVGFSEAGELLAVSKTVAFLPFFIAGYTMTDDKLAKIRRCNKITVIALMLMLFVLVVIFVAYGYPISKTFTMKMGYKSIGLSNLLGTSFRAFALLAGFVLTFCLIAVVPDKQTIISGLGRNTMTVYLGHSFVIGFLQKLFPILGVKVAVNNLALVTFAVTLSVVICIAFGNNFARRTYERIMNKLSTFILN